MQNRQKYRWFHHAGQTLSIAFFLFIASPNHAVAYGGHHSGYGYQHYGHNGHHSYSGHYSHHGDIGTAGYVILGILGVAILSSIISSSNHYEQKRYHNPYGYQPPQSYNRPSRVSVKPPSYSSKVRKPVYSYESNEGWNLLTKGNARHALDIFAIQSQQDLNSGIPKVGFALAAAANGEMDRGIRTMRKAIKVDP
ncbi:MAG: hypothetical protein V3V89_04295, partial [Gammaproteobacteria bacterium]